MTLWGGRFSRPPDEAVWRFTVSTADRRLLGDDVAGSLAHVKMLGSVGLLLGEEETAELVAALEQIGNEARSGQFEFAESDEDVHSAVERRLGELVGPLAGKLGTGRSRNDQVALDLRLYLRRAARERRRDLASFAALLADEAEAAGQTIVASYTHLRQAQAVPFAHHLLAHAWALVRDAGRFADAERRIAVSPLGAGAGGGGSLPIDPERVAAELDLPATFDNSLDAVAARDFVAEYAFCCAQALADLSRLAEELILWGSEEFGWARFADSVTTGSSALPHKQNPDVAELVRAKAASVAGDTAALLALQKGLPLAYNRDLQEDKELVFHADDVLAGALEAMAAMVAGADFHPPPPSPWVGALDLAEALVERGVPFREAHRAVGTFVRRLDEEGRTPLEATEADLQQTHAEFRSEDLERLDPEESVARRRSPGGGSVASVRDQLIRIRRAVEALAPEDGDR